MSSTNNNSDVLNKPIFKCGAFKYISPDEVECVICSKPEQPKILTTAKHSMTTVLNHLKKHPMEKKKYDELSTPTPITRYLPRGLGSLSSLDRRVVHYLASTYSPFNIVDQPTFHALFQNAKSQETLKGHKHYRDNVLPVIYKYAFERVRSLLKDITWLSFTCDAWSGPNNAFFGLTAHGVTTKWERRRFVLNVREFGGSHTGENVRAKVTELLREWRVEEDHVHVVLHDEGSNMESAFKDDDVEDFACGAHKLNLVVRNGMWPNPKKGEVPTAVTRLLIRCREVVTHFRHSHLAAEELLRYQKQNNLKERYLIQDVATRWDTTYLMVHRLLDQRAGVNAYLVNHRNDLMISASEWTMLGEIEELLRPFTELSKQLCADSNPISFQLTVAKALESELGVYSGQNLQVEVAKMQRILEEKFGGLSYYKTVAVAHALDPRFKDTLITGVEGVEFRKNVVQWVGEHVGEEGPDLAVVTAVTRSPPAKRSSFMDTLRAKLVGPSGAHVGSSSSQPHASNDYRTELDKFFREPTTPSWDDDPLDWWKENATRFPLLAPVARRYLGAPASSAASEQTFSVARAVYDPRRSKMTPTKAEALIFLNRNLPLLNYRY